jgi:hypothetical protein
VALDIILLI